MGDGCLVTSLAVGTCLDRRKEASLFSGGGGTLFDGRECLLFFGGGRRHSLRWKKEALSSMEEEALSDPDPSEEAPTSSSGVGPGFGAAQQGVSAPRHTPEKSGAALMSFRTAHNRVCQAPLNKELGTESPSGLLRVSSLLIYPRPSPLFGLE